MKKIPGTEITIGTHTLYTIHSKDTVFVYRIPVPPDEDTRFVEPSRAEQYRTYSEVARRQKRSRITKALRVIMVTLHLLLLPCLVQKGHSFLNAASKRSIYSIQLAKTVATVRKAEPPALSLAMSSATTDAVLANSWSDLQKQVGETVVGKALNAEAELRNQGRGSAHVQNKLRKFGSDDEPQITLFRDHAGWYV